MTKQEAEKYLAGLVREREGCALHGLTDRVEAIDAEIAKVTLMAGHPVKRSSKRAEPA